METKVEKTTHQNKFSMIQEITHVGPVLIVVAGANYSMGVTKWGNLGKRSMYVFYFN